MTDHYKSRASTHADGCLSWGHGHYECAVGKIEQLEERVQRDEDLLRQALTALEFSDWYTRAKAKSTIDALRERLAETANDLTRCPNCGGPADNGNDREVPPNPYWCSKCTES